MKIFSIICEATNSLRLRRKSCRHHLQPLFLSNPRQKLFFEDRLLMHIIRGLKNVFKIPLTDAIHPNSPPFQHAYPWQELSGSTRYGDFPKKCEQTSFTLLPTSLAFILEAPWPLYLHHRLDPFFFFPSRNSSSTSSSRANLQNFNMIYKVISGWYSHIWWKIN